MIFLVAFHTNSSRLIPRKSPEFPLGISTKIVSNIWDGISPVSQMCRISRTSKRHGQLRKNGALCANWRSSPGAQSSLARPAHSPIRA